MLITLPCSACVISRIPHFPDECQTKYGNANAWRYCCRVFDLLTVAALIDDAVLCVHGGLSPEIRTLDHVRLIDRNQEIPHKGAFCDLVWSDPEEVDAWAIYSHGRAIESIDANGLMPSWPGTGPL